jgi:hypothetical protein
MGPPGPGSSQYGSRYSMSRTCGPRDIISLVIPRLGDNTLVSWTYVNFTLPESHLFIVLLSKGSFI